MIVFDSEMLDRRLKRIRVERLLEVASAGMPFASWCFPCFPSGCVGLGLSVLVLGVLLFRYAGYSVLIFLKNIMY